jgi:glycerate dehydrogenase
MEIVVTDGHTLNPGDLNWESLEELGTCSIYERSTAQENISRCKNADIAVTNKVVFDKNTINALPKLKLISVTATGYNIVDIEAARARGIVVTNVATYGTQSVAQMVFALLLELTQHVGHHDQTARQGRWTSSSDFCYWDYPLIELSGMTMGLVGFGRIGAATARIAKAFGMNVLAYDIVKPQSHDDYINFTDLDTVFETSDVVSLHCPLTGQNKGFVNSALLKKMRSSAFLINTSRGPLINERDLAQALNSGLIAGAGLDVLSSEPPPADNPLLTARNCIITPHIAWATKSARKRLLDVAVDNIRAFIQGRPKNVVS